MLNDDHCSGFDDERFYDESYKENAGGEWDHFESFTDTMGGIGDDD